MVERTEVFYDGRCAWCRLAARAVPRAAEAGSLVFIDFTAGHMGELPLPPAELDTALTARSEDGVITRGFDAVLAIASRVTGLRWIARFGRMAPMGAVGSALYRLLAAIRPRSGPPDPH